MTRHPAVTLAAALGTRPSRLGTAGIAHVSVLASGSLGCHGATGEPIETIAPRTGGPDEERAPGGGATRLALAPGCTIEVR